MTDSAFSSNLPQPFESAPCVLIVDDSESDRTTYSRYLQSDGDTPYHILEAETLEQGLELWRSHRPDIVLIDYLLPDGEGLELLAAMGQDSADAKQPAIVLTGQGDERVAVQAMKLGAIDYLVKRDVTAFSLRCCVTGALRLVELNDTLQRSQHEQAELSQTLQSLNASLEQQVNQRTRELATAEVLFRTAFETAATGISITAPDGHFLEVNPAFCQILGYSVSELLSLTFHDITYTDDLADDLDLTQKLLQGEIRSFNMEKRYWHKNGDLIWVDLTVALVRDDQQQPLYLIAQSQNISDRKQAELALAELNQALEAKVEERTAALQASEAHNRAIIEAIPDLLLRVKRDGTCIEYIPPSLQTERFVPIEQHLSEILPPDLLQRQLNVIEQALSTGELQVYEHQLVKNNQTVDEEIRIIAINSDEVLMIVQDISERARFEAERKQAEAKLQASNTQLARSNLELARANRLKDEFVATMSHELRTPLNAILGMTEGLQDEVFGAINEQQHDALHIIQRRSTHLLNLINDILDLSSIAAGQLTLNRTPTDINSLCQPCVALFQQQVLQKQIQLHTKISPDLPRVLLDERRIQQVLINLLNNAIKFTPNEGQITLDVKLIQPASGKSEAQPEQLQPGCWVRVSVSDTGIGIAPDHLTQLFQPFVQIDSGLNRQYEGTGLGLAIVKQIVELHGGKVGVSSIVGVGSRFTVDLPVGTTAPSPESTSPALATEATTRSPLPALSTPLSRHDAVSNPLILLVDDNPAHIFTLTNYLKAKSYRIVVAANGEEAIAFSRTHHPDVILMAIQLSDMDGLEAIQQIRHLPNLDGEGSPTLPPIPIIALTELVIEGDREKYLAAGANDYFTKPFKLKHLANAIQQLLVTPS